MDVNTTINEIKNKGKRKERGKGKKERGEGEKEGDRKTQKKEETEEAQKAEEQEQLANLASTQQSTPINNNNEQPKQRKKNKQNTHPFRPCAAPLPLSCASSPAPFGAFRPLCAAFRAPSSPPWSGAQPLALRGAAPSLEMGVARAPQVVRRHRQARR